MKAVDVADEDAMQAAADTTETVSVLRAEMTDSPPKFVNCISYRLPDTGGTGTLPYLAGGITLISAAFLLPLIRRRKEDECDS